MVEDIELLDDCYAEELSDELQPGDVCRAVPLLVINSVSEPFESADLEQGELLLKACWSRAVVVRIFEDLAIVAPIMTAEQAGDDREFETVIEAARHDTHFVRLPPLPDEWDEPAVAFLFLPQTVPADLLMSRRAASLTPDARSSFEHRAAQAFQPL